MRRFFRHKLNLDSEYLIQHRIDFLSGVTVVFYDMCPKSCSLYAGEREKRTDCEFCGTLRMSNGKPACRFSYLPLIPHMKGWFECPEMVRRMSYRSQYNYVPGEISDVFDGEHYKDHRNTYVKLDGKTLQVFFRHSRCCA
jgi:hypothetical protein